MTTSYEAYHQQQLKTHTCIVARVPQYATTTFELLWRYSNKKPDSDTGRLLFARMCSTLPPFRPFILPLFCNHTHNLALKDRPGNTA